MEKSFSRYTATDHMVSGAYKSEYGDDNEITVVQEKIKVE